MTQTAKGQKNTPAKTPQRSNRPGQRQQERLMRIARRKRRQRIWTSVIIAVVLIAIAGLGFWQYQRVLAQNAANVAAKHAAATANVAAHIGPTCATASSTPAVYDSTPKAGPTNPPSAAGTPAKNADGLQCLDLKVGGGTVASSGSTVSVEYTGWLQRNGKKFDSSYDRGGQSFPVTSLGHAQIIQGWNEGLLGMKVGGTRRLVIPPSIGYGAQANQGIPANSTLIFDITVLSVQ